jgi:hypothetical protein
LEQYLIPNLGNANALVSIDPNNWIINDVGTTVKDPNFTLAINDLGVTNDYLVSPNPSHGNYLIETEMTGQHTYSIFDTRGRLIESGSFENVVELDLVQQQNGNYIVQLTNDSGEKRVKILVKN